MKTPRTDLELDREELHRLQRDLRAGDPDVTLTNGVRSAHVKIVRGFRGTDKNPYMFLFLLPPNNLDVVLLHKDVIDFVMNP